MKTEQQIRDKLTQSKKEVTNCWDDMNIFVEALEWVLQDDEE